MYAQFNGFEIKMTKDDASIGCHSGQCDGDVEYLVNTKAMKHQLDSINPDLIREELAGYGTWSADELLDDVANRRRIVWIAASDIWEAMP